MCGIIGQVSHSQKISRSNFDLMRDTLTHRGPDGFGSYFDPTGHVALGHRRLSIIDLSENGAQPMCNSDKTVWITYNGECYNYRELKEQLQQKYHFKSSSDTEVILHAYEEWGIKKTLEKINGMFAFSIYDSNTNMIYGARDRIGIKPYYYLLNEQTFIFSSEIKGIVKSEYVDPEIDWSGIYDFFLYRYIPYPRTCYKDMFKLAPGYYLTFNTQTFELNSESYWELDNEKQDVNEDDLISSTERLLLDSVEKRLIADVAVETFLSGGIDSSCITAMAASKNPKISGFSIKVDDPDKDELESAQFVAEYLNINLDYDTLDPKMFNEICDQVISLYDEPFGDSSIIPTYLLCKHTSSKTKVALSGDGGDELFFGYNWHEQFHNLNTPVTDPFETYRTTVVNTFSLDIIKQLFPGKQEQLNDSSYIFRQRIGKAELGAEDVTYLDLKTFLVDDILTKVDIASMANSLEVRVPYLDHRLVELVYKTPVKVLFKERQKKYILKKLSENWLPVETIHKRKQGFSAPTVTWLTTNFKKELLQGNLVREGIIDKRILRNVLKYQTTEERLWLLYVFEKWYTNNFVEKSKPLSIFDNIISHIYS